MSAVQGRSLPTTLALLAKHWTPGQTKTRLASTIGPHAAAEIQKRCLGFLLERLNACGNQRILYFSPAHQQNDFRCLAGEAWKVAPQVGLDLGTRIAHCFREMSSGLHERVIVIGSDCPTVSPTTIQLADRALEQHDVVIGPSADGGYYLIGMRRFESAVFSDIAWSTPQVFDQTVAQVRRSGLSLQLLETQSDIDDWASLQVVIETLKKSGDAQIVELSQQLCALTEEATARPVTGDSNVSNSG
ncbi:MAG: TIGR04282 family arsenosugar biosynthesis glycosyltransferase [Pirellulaceae bacterium]